MNGQPSQVACATKDSDWSILRPSQNPYTIYSSSIESIGDMLARSVAAANSLLMLHADVPLPLAKVAQLVGQPYAVTASALKTLEKRGLAVRSTRAGQDEFAPNRESPYYPMAYATALVDLPLAEPLHGQRVLRRIRLRFALPPQGRQSGQRPGPDAGRGVSR